MKSCEESSAADVTPCERAGTEEGPGTACVGNDLESESRIVFNKTVLDYILSHDDIYDILSSRRKRILREETMEQEMERRVGNTEFCKERTVRRESHVLCDACSSVVCQVI